MFLRRLTWTDTVIIVQFQAVVTSLGEHPRYPSAS